MVVSVVPPVRVIAERKVAAHLRRYDATSADKAMGYAPIRWTHERALKRLRSAGVVQGSDTALWLDEAAWAERQAKRRKRALTVLALAAVSAGIASLTTLRG